MPTEWIKTVVVKPGGVVEVVVAELTDGDQVEVLVRRNGNGRQPTRQTRPGFGADRSRISISDDFDAPLPGFEEYT